jgi:hypothetical protein
MAQPSLNVIKPSRSVSARKTGKIQSDRGEIVGGNFAIKGVLKSGRITGSLTLPWA